MIINIGKILIIIGILILIVGLIITFSNHKFEWFGNMPFDFKYENKTTKIYAPFGTMILISIFLSIIINLISKWFK